MSLFRYSTFRSKRFVMQAGLGCLLLVLPGQLHAKTAEELRQVEQKLAEQKQQAAALEEKAKAANNSVQELRQKLIETAAAYQTKAEEQDRLEDKLDQLVQDIDTRTKALKSEKHQLAYLTDALIDLSRQPPETNLLQTGLTTDHIHRAILLRSAVPRLKEKTEAFARDLAEMQGLQEQLAEQKQLVIEAQTNLQGQQHDLDQLIKARQGLLQRTEEQKAAISRQLVSLSNEAKDLRQLLEKVTPQHLPRNNTAPGLASSLKAPVSGTLIRRFGAKDADEVTSQGLTFAGLSGSPVVAPLAGHVVFAGPFRGYGQILILQHAGGYHSFLAGFGRIDVDMGQDVGKGEPLGVLPVKKEGRPEFYFEWRHNNEAVDPTSGIALSKSE